MQQAASERKVRDVGDTELAAERQHFLVVVPAKKVVVVLENGEPRGSLLARHLVGLGELLGREVRAPDRSHLSGLHQLVERAERVADRNRRIGPVQVVEIDAIGAQPLERALERAPYRRRSGAAVARLPGELRGENDIVAPCLEDLAELALALAAVPVDLGRVEERDPGVERGLDDGACPREVEAPSEVVATDADDGYAQSALAQIAYLHLVNASDRHQRTSLVA